MFVDAHRKGAAKIPGSEGQIYIGQVALNAESLEAGVVGLERMVGAELCRTEDVGFCLYRQCRCADGIGYLQSFRIEKIYAFNFGVNGDEFFENALEVADGGVADLSDEPVRQHMDVSGEPAARAQGFHRALPNICLNLADAAAGLFFERLQVRSRAGDGKALEKIDAEYMAGANFVNGFYAFGKAQRAGHLGQRMYRFDDRLPVRIFGNSGYEASVYLDDVRVYLDEAVYVRVFAAEIIDNDKESGTSVAVDEADKVVGRIRFRFDKFESDVFGIEAHLPGDRTDMGRLQVVAGADDCGVDVHENHCGRSTVERPELLEGLLSAEPVEFMGHGFFVSPAEQFAGIDKFA